MLWQIFDCSFFATGIQSPVYAKQHNNSWASASNPVTTHCHQFQSSVNAHLTKSAVYLMHICLYSPALRIYSLQDEYDTGRR